MTAFTAQFYSARDRTWYNGAYLGPDEEAAKECARDYWRRGADGVRVLAYREEVLYERIRERKVA